MKLFKTVLGMETYVNDMLAKVDDIVKTMRRPRIPDSVSPLEYVYMAITECFNDYTPEPHFTTNKFRWADLVQQLRQNNACDVLVLAVVLATLKPHKADHWGWDIDHKLTYDVAEAVELWQKLYREVIRRIIHVNRGSASVDELKLSDLLSNLDVRVKMYKLCRCDDGEYRTKTFLFNPFNGVVWHGDNYESMYRVYDGIPSINTNITNTPIVDIASIKDVHSVNFGTGNTFGKTEKLMKTRVAEIISSHVGNSVSWNDWFPAILRDTPIADALWHTSRDVPRKGYAQYTYDQFLIDVVMCDDTREWIATLLYYMSHITIRGKRAYWDSAEFFDRSPEASTQFQTRMYCRGLISSSETIPEAIGKFRCHIDLYDTEGEWVGSMDPNTRIASVLTQVKF